MKVGIDGLGVVGLRVARELLATPGVDTVLAKSSRKGRVELAQGSLGHALRPWEDEVPDVVVLCGLAGTHVPPAGQWLPHGVPVVSVSDDPADVAALLDLAPIARHHETTLLAGVAFSPGLSCILARHAANAFDEVSELQVAMVGAGGPGCVKHRQRLLSEHGTELRDGEWIDAPAGSAKLLTWFPDPIGARDVVKGNLSEPLLLHRMFPGAGRLTARGAIERADRVWGRLPRMGPRSNEADPGAIVVEAHGTVGGVVESLVYAVLDRPATATAALVASLAPMLSARSLLPGAHGVAEVVEPLPVLKELARRGVKAATFDAA
jgi:hypothetical protein